MENANKEQLPFKQELINYLIWLLIINSVFAYMGRLGEKDNGAIIVQIVWWLTGFFLFCFLFAFTKVLKRKYKNSILSFIISLAIMMVINTILVLVF